MKQNKSSKPDNRLPNKLWELLQVALMDLTLAEMMPEYEIDMSIAHSPNGKCSVCFAGSVIAAKENFMSFNKEYSLAEFDRETNWAYDALDECRKYNFASAIRRYSQGMDHNEIINIKRKIMKHIKREVPYYSTPELFKANMETAATILKKYDL